MEGKTVAYQKPVYDFDEKARESVERRKLLDSFFYPHIAHRGQWVYLQDSFGSIELQRKQHIDTVASVSLRANEAHSVTIDEKMDSVLRSPRTILLEHVSAVETKTPGWAKPGVSSSDWLLWAFPLNSKNGLEVYLYWLPQLAEWFWKLHTAGAFPTFAYKSISSKRGSRTWTTKGVSVPVADIPCWLTIANGVNVIPQLELF
jgi:hypothetical protein